MVFKEDQVTTYSQHENATFCSFMDVPEETAAKQFSLLNDKTSVARCTMKTKHDIYQGEVSKC